ncbi:MAG TPA: hypothetical protein ENI76_05815 [Ignavibacteria bacterium]|nr:hypothetical protein [Ignavibacteria bacterium]
MEKPRKIEFRFKGYKVIATEYSYTIEVVIQVIYNSVILRKTSLKGKTFEDVTLAEVSSIMDDLIS